ncbi:hypothetical protein DVA86_18900 [Streptomyces armeniacus]|uniref:Uncharacterized protein n=1 Tax=Streptomyces armeniacus TaxID=83291 RepID=A0A345XRZ2_9ACTN|nr:hypothetical protein DVA86_18900 [Streptomyces armeniacus]
MLVLGLMYAHGVSAESTAGHLTGGASAAPSVHMTFGEGGCAEDSAASLPMTAPSAPGHGGHEHNGHESGHAVPDCVSAQPHDDVELEVPSTPLRWEQTRHDQPPLNAASDVAAESGVLQTLLNRSTILRV